MNKKRQILGFILFLSIVLCMESCDKTDDPVIVPSPDLVYVGSWAGSTSTMSYLSLEVRNVEQKAFITGFKLEIVLEGGSVYHEESITEGITEVGNHSFELIPQGGGYIKGYFLSDTNAYGQYSVYNSVIGDTVKGNFLINNIGKVKTINSFAQFNGKFDNTNLHLGQEVDLVKPIIGQFSEEEYVLFNSGLKLLNISTGGSDTLFQVNIGKIQTPVTAAAFANLIRARSVPYQTQDNPGVEIIYTDKGNDLKRWSTAFGTGNQDGSSFVISESIKIDGTDTDFLLYKIIAKFNCKLYDGEGNTKTVTDGNYIGFIKCDFGEDN